MSKVIEKRTDKEVSRKGRGRVFPVVMSFGIFCFIAWDQSSGHLVSHVFGRSGAVATGYVLAIIAIACFCYGLLRRRR